MMYRNILISSIAATLFTGCAYDHADRALEIKQEARNMLGSERVVQDYRKNNPLLKKNININVRHKWVYSLVKEIAAKKGIPIDKSFIPSTDYRVTAKGKYDLQDALFMIQKQTGVEYIIDDGIMKVKNKDFIDAYEPIVEKCGRNHSSRFSLSLKNAPIKKIFAYFIEKKGYTVEYDLHYHDTIDNVAPISFSYRGCSVREALKRAAKASDLKIVFKAGKNVIVRDYDTLKATVPSYYSLKYSSDSNELGESKGTGTRLTDNMNQQKEFQSILQTFMSPNGKAYLSGKGYLVIEDTPSSIKRLKKILNKELMAQQNINLDITIVSVELKDAFSSGVDWQKIFKESLNAYNLSLGITDKIGDNAFNIGHLSSNGKESILQLLGEYGKTKIVKEYHLSTKSGILSTLKAVDIIPYVTETSQISNGIAETQKEAKSVESGIIMNIKPNIDGNMVNMSVDITVSEYLGDKEFSDGFKLPMLKTNTMQAPLTAKIGNTILLTGIKLRDDKTNYSGLPGVHKHLGDLSILTGKNEDSVKETEYLIFIHPGRRGRQ